MLRNGMMLPLSCHVTIFIRETTFRHVLARVGEVRSLIPSSVHVMALTATATSSDRIAVTQMIGLQNPYTLKQTPSKPNIVYDIGSFKAVPNTFKKFADRLRFERVAFPKTLMHTTLLWHNQCQYEELCAS